jgi:catechol 2,3-dioxygenase-like lactoylglutathione lyase family enzyme
VDPAQTLAAEMTPMASQTHHVKRISPMLAVADMDETVDFYVTVLRFNVAKKFPEYAIVERDGATIHLMKAANESVLKAVRGHTEIYIEVEDIASLWNHVKTFKDKYKARDLFEQPYGMTEFHIGDPNECLVFVGQKTP